MTTVWIGFTGHAHEGYTEPELCFATKEAAHTWAAEVPNTREGSDWREILEFPVGGGGQVVTEYGYNHGYDLKDGRLFCRRCVQEACAHECVVLEHYNRLIHRCTKCGHDRYEPNPASVSRETPPGSVKFEDMVEVIADKVFGPPLP